MDKCPHIRNIHYGDETSMDICELNTKPCLLEEGLKCDYWEEIQRDEDEEYKFYQDQAYLRKPFLPIPPY